MDLSQKDIDYINMVVDTAQALGLESVLIEPDMVRAISEERTIILHQTENIEQISVGTICLTRFNLYKARYNLAQSVKDFKIVASVTNDDDQWVRFLKFKGKGLNIDFRCAEPSQILVPKQINFSALALIKFDDTLLPTLQKGVAAMGSDLITILNNKDGVSFELSDVNSDTLKYIFSSDISNVSEDPGELTGFAYRYPIKLILSLLKENNDSEMEIDHRGIMRMKINGLSVYLIPQV